ncbi:MAG: hypothetical protein ACYTAS_24190, partial [Planctomycetota bacterium]
MSLANKKKAVLAVYVDAAEGIQKTTYEELQKGDAMRRFCKSLLLCGIAFLWVSAANAQDVTIRRVSDRVITLSMSNLSMHTNVTVIETRKGLVCI